MDLGKHLRLVSKPGEGTIGIYVENHEDRNQEFIWMRCDFWKKRKLPGARAHLLEGVLISEACALEESGSRHQ